MRVRLHFFGSISVETEIDDDVDEEWLTFGTKLVKSDGFIYE